MTRVWQLILGQSNMRNTAQLLLLLGLVVAPAAFAGQRLEPIHPERERMSASARRRAVLDDLDTLLTGPATPTSIATAPHLANNGLCQRDVIVLEYRHTNDSARGGPFKPFGIADVYKQYHSIGYSGEISESEAQRACRSLDGIRDYWAYSDSEGTADDGLITLKETAAAVRANNAISFDCSLLGDSAIEARCLSEFLAVADRPESVSECSEGPTMIRRQCFVYGLGTYRVTITRVWPTSGGGPATGVKLEYQEIVVT